MHPRRLLDAMLQAQVRESGAWADPITDDEWATFEGMARTGQSGMLDAIGRIVTARRIHRAGRPSRGHTPDRQPGHRLRSTREAALAQYLAAYVEHEPRDRFGVRRYRHDQLNNRLLAPSAAAEWIVTRAATPKQLEKARSELGRGQLLAYLEAGNKWTKHVFALPGSPLDRLRVVSERLSSFCGWHLARATMFVLTGERPPVAAIVADVAWKAPVGARSRIVLNIDPTCPPHEVAASYRRFRNQHFPRLRRLSPRHTQLAVFFLENQQLPVADQMALWNSSVRSRRFKKLSVFALACRQAVRRLTELPGAVGPGL